jgi:hypothetical protein
MIPSVPCFRHFVLAFALALWILLPLHAQELAPTLVKIRVDSGHPLGQIPEDFLGFGYETSTVAQTNFFSPQNATMIRLYQNLSPHGLVRIGGIISDHTCYEADATPVVQTMRGTTVINRANLVDLGGFLRATGWKVMWGLNLGTGSREEAVHEAQAVNSAMGDCLQSFQIGNEIENLRRFGGKYAAYHSTYLDYKAAIRAVLPLAPFSGPDSVGSWSYITPFAHAELHDLQLLTVHYYRGDSHATNATLPTLLQPDTGWNQKIHRLQKLGRSSGLGYRINEVNSFYGGGKAGVSDTFGSALWCLDYLFNLASHGCAGVNMETDINQLGFISHYSPIVHDSSGHCSIRPEYYGMLAFALAGKGEILRLDLNKQNVNLTAYATRNHEGSIWITMINKESTGNAAVETILPEGYGSAAAFRLVGPSLTSKDHVTLAGEDVAADGTWTPDSPKSLLVQGGVARLAVPHACAVLLRLSAN